MAGSRFLTVSSASRFGLVPNSGDDRMSTASGRVICCHAERRIELGEAADLPDLHFDARAGRDGHHLVRSVIALAIAPPLQQLARVTAGSRSTITLARLGIASFNNCVDFVLKSGKSK